MNAFAALAALWRRFSARERTVIAAGALLAAAILLYVLLWEPGLAARRTLSSALPRLRAQLADMRLQREEIMALRRQIDAAARRGDLQTLLQASLRETAFAESVERVSVLPDGGAQVLIGSAAFDAWVEWLERAQREFGVRLQSATITPPEPGGRARIEASFAARGVPTAGSTR